MMEFQNIPPYCVADQQQQPAPMSRTHQYRKVMKPLLERKRRARINKCLDELKDLMVNALQSEGESITKLEKADVLELTVKHLRKLKSEDALGLTPQATYAGKFKSGYTHCAQEVVNFINMAPGIDMNVSTRLLSHLSGCVQALEIIPPSALNSDISSSPPSTSRSSPIQKQQQQQSRRISTPTQSPISSDDQDIIDVGEEQALDLSSNVNKRKQDNIIGSSSSRRRKSSTNDSDSGNSSLNINDNHAKDVEDKSWRPW